MQSLMDTYNKTKYLYEKYYDIHICKIEEIDEVISFIDNYWQKNHILTKSRKLLDWQHYDEKNSRYNFVIAKSRKTGEIHGVIGFILSSIYDDEIKTPIRWGAIWKIREDVAVKGLGLTLKGYMETTIPVSYIGGVGLSKYSKAIDEKLGEEIGKLSQYYIANPEFRELELIDKPAFPDITSIEIDETKYFVPLSEDEFCEMAHSVEEYIMPYKSIKYYINRYYRHPIYSYGFIGIFDSTGITSVFVYRKCMVGNRAGIFIVDYIGNPTAIVGCYKLFLDFLQKEKAEHISFPCRGIPDICLKQAGFMLRDDSDVILPVYYEPFVRSNVDLDYHFWSKNEFLDGIIVKGDADQDRPNRLPEERNG